MTAPEALARIQAALAQADPLAVIEQLMPKTLPEAFTWIRMRPVWDEYRGQYPDQVLGVAAVISRRAMKVYGLRFAEDGTVRGRDGKQTRRFTMDVRGEAVNVEYVRNYFPGTDHLYFTSPEPGPHPLSNTGYFSHFCLPEAVEACGGPEAYAARYSVERLAGREKEFVVAFEGKWPEVKRKKPKPVEREVEREPEVEAVESEPPKPVVGPHTALVREPEPEKKMVQRGLW